MRKLIAILIGIFFSIVSVAQIEIWLNDGTILKPLNYKIDTGNKTIIYLNQKRKIKYLDDKVVYAIIDQQDTLIFNKPENLSINEGFEFLKGVNDGYKHKDNKILISSFLIGTASGFGLPRLGFSGIWTIIPNLGSTVLMGMTIKDKNLPQGSEMYKKGYQFSARKKKVILAIEGSIAGLITGNLIGYLTKKQ